MAQVKKTIPQESLLRSIAESISDAVIACDKEFKVFYWNHAAERLYGWTAAEMNGTNPGLLVKTTFFNEDKDKWKEILFSTGHWEGEVNQTARDGRTLYIFASISTIVDANGTQVGFVAVNRDMTAQKNRDLELKKYAERFEQAQQVGQVGVFDWDIQKGAVWWSTEEERLFGLIPGSFKGIFETWSDTIHPDDRERVSQAISECIDNRGDLVTEFRVVLPTGVRWLAARGHVSYDKNGKPLRMIGVNFDISARKFAEDSLLFLDEASKLLTSSLDYSETLKKVTEIAVPNIADWCSVELLNEEGKIELFSVSHKDPAKVEWAWQLRRERPVDMNSMTGIPHVIRTAKPEFYPVITDEMIKSAAKSEKDLKLIRKIGFSSLMIVPILVQGKAIGAIQFVSAESKKHFNNSDFRMAQQLADRVSLAIENARLYKIVEAERERLDELVANVPGVVWEAWGEPDSKNQQINFVNRYVEEMLGYTVEEWLGTPNFWLTIVHPDDRMSAVEGAARTYKSDDIGTNRFRWVKKNGDILWVEAHSYAIKDKKGRSVGMRGVTMDISERMELERRKDDFIGMASHELKTPLTSIKVFTQLLQKQFGEYLETSKYLGRMNDQVDRLTLLINDLLDVSKIQAGKLSLRYEPFLLQELIEEIIENMQPTSPNHTIHLAKSEDIQIIGDRDRLGQVLVNLLSNATKYSPDNKEVNVWVSKQEDQVTISVQDHGIGIGQEHLHKLFDRFYRVYDADEITYPGLGIGLYISHEIVKRHGGSMHVESVLGEGSTFSFTIPLSR